MRQGMFGKFQKDRRAREGQPTDELMIELYAPLVFDEARTLVMELAASRVELDSDSLDHIKEVAGEEFAARVQDLRVRIRETVAKDHLGFFDGWVKRVVNENFGTGTDFAMEHGDQSSNFLALVLKGQAKKHSAIALVMEFLGVANFQETKRFVEPKLEEARKKIEAVEAEIEAKKKTGAPKQADFTSFAEYLKAKVAYDQLMRTEAGRLGELKQAIAWLKNWVAAREDERPERTKRQMLLDQIAGLQEQITGLKAEESDAAGKGEYGIAGNKKLERVKLEAKVKELEAEIAKPDAPSQGEAQPSTAPKPGEGAPMGAKPTVTGDPEAVKAKAGDVNAKIEALKAEIAKLKAEIGQHEAAVDEKERKAVEKSKAARAEGVSDEEAETLLREARTLRTSADASSKAAEKIYREVEGLQKQIAELEKQVKPVVEKPKKVKAASASTDEDTVIVKVREDLKAAIMSGDEAAEAKATRRLKALGVSME